jgi:predicted NACHT family NTPase
VGADKPLAGATIPAVWELALLAAAFALDVWAEVRPTLVGRAAEAVKFWIDCLISRHRQHYLKDIVFQHRNFDVKGLSTQATFTLELEHVFVDLSVAPIAPHEASADMIRKLPPELREGRRQVWDFLEGVGDGTAKLVLLGAPGSGKTTLVKHIALTFAHGRSPKANLRASRNLPILLFLREHAEAITNEANAKLSELVAEYQKEERQIDIPAVWFDTQLKRGRCVVMLDGLDEVADPEARRKVALWADRQMSIHGGNRFVITSRPHGYRDNPLGSVNVLEVRPFTSDQVRDFVHRWYVANEIKSQQRDYAGVRQDAKTGALDLLDRLHGAPALSDLAVNPLLLTMIATVHRYRSSLPGRRVELYAQICEVSLGKRQQSKGLQLDLTPAQKQRVLEPLAWEMMVARKREIPKSDACAAIQGTLRHVNQRLAPGDFLVSVENDSSLLLEKEAGGVYAFAHHTFQEFLAACHAQENAAPARRGKRVSAHESIELLTRNIGDGWWAETIRLFAAKGNASPILRACISRPALDPEALALAMQ